MLARPKPVFALVIGFAIAAVAAGCASRVYNNDSGASSKKEKKVEEPEALLQVEQLVPSDGSTDVPVDAPIKVRLTTPVGNCTGSSIVVENSSGGTSDKEGPTCYFKPRKPLEANTQYKVTLLKGLSSKGGQQLAEDMTWSFRTGDRTVKQGPNLASVSGLKDGDGVKVYRVQGGVGKNQSRERFKLDADGKVRLTESEGMLFFNMGDDARALWWLKNRGTKSYAFKIEITKEYAQYIRFTSILQKLGASQKFVPQIVDFNQAGDQYGLPPNMFAGMIASVIPGTPRIMGESDFEMPAVPPANIPPSDGSNLESGITEAGRVD